MLFGLVVFLLRFFSFVYLVYKTMNFIQLNQNSSNLNNSKYEVTSWIVFIVASNLTCSCTGVVGFFWNSSVLLGMVFGLLNSKKVYERFFDEQTYHSLIHSAKGFVGKYLPKEKPE